MPSLLNFGPSARSLSFLGLMTLFPAPAFYSLLALIAVCITFFFICLVIGGPLWDRWMQVLRLVVRPKRGG